MNNDGAVPDRGPVDSFTTSLSMRKRERIESIRDFSRNVRERYVDNPVVLSFDETLQLASILAELRMDTLSIEGGFLHDFYRFPAVMEHIKEKFGGNVYDLVGEYGRVSLLAKQTTSRDNEDDYISLVLSVANDFRVVMMLISNRYVRIVNHEKLPREEQLKQAERVMAFYAPLAHRMGLFKYKTVLEKNAFEILHPDIAADITEKMSNKRYELNRYIDQTVIRLRYELEKYGIAADITGRTKEPVSIYKKMQKTGRPFDHIYDILAVRAIVPTVPDCYKVLAVVQQLYTPVMEEFDDYIQRPKVNGYQSLHVLLEDEYKRKFELQIRTEEMHRTSEIGIAAHWNYKAGKARSSTDTFFRWFREHSSKIRNTYTDKTFNKFFRMSQAKSDIFVVTPKGDLKKLTRGSTPIDFAFAVHRDIGIRCSGAKVNGHIVPFDRELRNGDRVEIMTSNRPTVNSDWMHYARSPKARSIIRGWLRKQMRDHSIKLGEEILARAFKKSRIAMTKEALKSACVAFDMENTDDLFTALGSGKISSQMVIQKFILPDEKEEKSTIEERISARRRSLKGIKVGNMDNLMVNFGKCCLPIPGDPIVGYITRGKGVTVHRKSCTNTHQLRNEPEREIEVEWEEETDKMFTAGLKVVVFRSNSFLKDLTPILGSKHTTLLNYAVNQVSDSTAFIMVVEVTDADNLNAVVRAMKSMKQVKSVSRLHYSEFKSLLKETPVLLTGN